MASEFQKGKETRTMPAEWTEVTGDLVEKKFTEGQQGRLESRHTQGLIRVLSDGCWGTTRPRPRIRRTT